MSCRKTLSSTVWIHSTNFCRVYTTFVFDIHLTSSGFSQRLERTNRVLQFCWPRGDPRKLACVLVALGLLPLWSRLSSFVRSVRSEQSSWQDPPLAHLYSYGKSGTGKRASEIVEPRIQNFEVWIFSQMVSKPDLNYSRATILEAAHQGGCHWSL